MNKQELKKAFEENLITEQQYKDELFKAETEVKDKRKPHRIKESPSEAEIGLIIDNTKKAHHKLAFILAYFSGMRVSEIINLKRDDIDMEQKRIFVRQGKYCKDRVVPLPKGFTHKSIALVPLECGIRALEKAFENSSVKAGVNPVIGTIEKEGKKVNIRKYTFHSLRHGFGTRLIEKGVPMNQVQLLMGHSNLATTSVYTKANPVDALKSYEEKF